MRDDFNLTLHLQFHLLPLAVAVCFLFVILERVWRHCSLHQLERSRPTEGGGQSPGRHGVQEVGAVETFQRRVECTNWDFLNKRAVFFCRTNSQYRCCALIMSSIGEQYNELNLKCCSLAGYYSSRVHLPSKRPSILSIDAVYQRNRFMLFGRSIFRKLHCISEI